MRTGIQHHWLIIKTELFYHTYPSLLYINLIKQFTPYFWLHSIEIREPAQAGNASEMHFYNIQRILTVKSLLLAFSLVEEVQTKENDIEHKYFSVLIASISSQNLPSPRKIGCMPDILYSQRTVFPTNCLLKSFTFLLPNFTFCFELNFKHFQNTSVINSDFILLCLHCFCPSNNKRNPLGLNYGWRVLLLQLNNELFMGCIDLI